jgi:hypothetical protein
MKDAGFQTNRPANRVGFNLDCYRDIAKTAPKFTGQG